MNESVILLNFIALTICLDKESVNLLVVNV